MTTSTKGTLMRVQNYDLNGAVAAMKNGGLILYPTDTLWSIGCDATNPLAIDRIARLKREQPSKSFEILVDSLDMLKSFVEHLHPRLETLLLYHVRPLTLFIEKAKNLPANLVGPSGNIAIRLVQDSFCRYLINELESPIVAATANVANMPIPGNFGGISSEIITGVDYVVKHRRYEKRKGQASVMVKLSDKSELIFLRE